MTYKTMNRKIKIAVVEDQPLFRKGIVSIINAHDDMELVFECSNGLEFLIELKNHIPDVVLMDVIMPVMDGKEAISNALILHPHLRIIALTLLSDKSDYHQMICSGVKGFLNKDVNLDELFKAINEVSKGGVYFCQNVLRDLMSNDDTAQTDNAEISEREKSILQYICQGDTNSQIAERLSISIKSVERCRAILVKKTDSRNTAHMITKIVLNKVVKIELAD